MLPWQLAEIIIKKYIYFISVNDYFILQKYIFFFYGFSFGEL